MQKLTIVCPHCTTLNTLEWQAETKEFPCSGCQVDLDDPTPIEVNDESCALHIKEDSMPILVDFYSNYCAPCLEMYDDYEAAAFGYSLKVLFLKVNTDNFQAVAKDYKVSSLPTIIAFKDGKEVNRVSGTLTQYEFSKWAKELIAL